MFKFKAKKVLVTGASRGIGKAIAQGFAMNRAQVSLVYRKEKELADNLRNSLPGENHICVRSDVSVSCLIYTSPSPRDLSTSRMPSSA